MNTVVQLLGPAQQYSAFQEQPELMRPDEPQLTECRTTYPFLRLLPSFISFKTAATSLSVVTAPPQYCSATSICVCTYVHEREQGQSQVFIVAYSIYIYFLKHSKFGSTSCSSLRMPVLLVHNLILHVFPTIPIGRIFSNICSLFQP